LNDGYIELHINAWDALAGILLVREAGGCTNDFLADDGLRNGNCLVAVTPELGPRIADILAAVRCPISWIPPCPS
jgi:myo-inositol-1(or 4)-monophosphatase